MTYFAIWLCFTDNDDILLASCGQDCFIRLWRISPRSGHQLAAQEVSTLMAHQDIRMKETTFTFVHNSESYFSYIHRQVSQCRLKSSWI